MHQTYESLTCETWEASDLVDHLADTSIDDALTLGVAPETLVLPPDDEAPESPWTRFQVACIERA